MSYREVYYKSILKYKLEKFIKVKKITKKSRANPGQQIKYIIKDMRLGWCYKQESLKNTGKKY
jgi:hypothetical protein